MIRSRMLLTVTTLAGALLVGCVARPKNVSMSSPMSPERVDAIRADMKSTFPAARVGVVAAVQSDYAFVSQLETAGLLSGQVVTFLDTDESVVANGVIAKVEADGLTVKFDAGKRPVMVGDVGVKF